MIKVVTVSVTANDIANGTKEDCRDCPIAIAMNRLLIGGFFSSIGNPRFSIRDVNRPLDKLYMSDLPNNACKFITDFDRRHRNDTNLDKPFEFSTILPSEYLREPEKGRQL